jgi:hypothetical protein
VIIDLIDEPFRHVYGLRRFTKGHDAPFGAVVGVLNGSPAAPARQGRKPKVTIDSPDWKLS